MNVKKDTLKTMCAVLACSTLLSGLLAANATDVIISESPMDDSTEIETSDSGWTTEENSFEEIEVTYKQSSSYNVIIPKTIALDTSKQAVYSVKVTGDIDANERVHVVPVDMISSTESIDFYMKDQTPDSKKAEVVATVAQSKFYWNSEEVANGYEETNNSVSAPDLTAGTWKGTFQVAINLETSGGSTTEHEHNYVDGVCTGCGEKDPNAEHEHSYVDGKCDCGAIDPDHTHNYEDGTCTICGKETDPYEVAPESEFRNWKYALDNDNDIITLQQYTNTSATDVIVYANYVVNGKTYKTQLADFGYDGIGGGSANYMFCNKENIKTIKFSDSIDTSNVTKMDRMFFMNTWGVTSALTSIDFGKGFDTSNVTSMSSMFNGCASLINLDLSRFNTSKVTSMYQMFDDCKSLSSLDLSNFDTSKVTRIDYMFHDCSSLTSIIQNFDTSNITHMTYMFNFCNSLENLDVSNFDTSNVTDMSHMFNACKSLANLDVSNFDTSNVTDMNSMFAYVPVTNIDLGSFNTSKVTNMGNMFSNCNGLTDLDLANFDTSNVTDMGSMFMDCSALTSLDLSSFDTNNVTKMTYMFIRDTNLKTIYVTSGKWSTSKADTANMFTNCGTSKVTYK